MIQKSILMRILVVSLCWLSACNATDQPLPMRKDCIVKIDILWPADLGRDQREAMLNDMSLAISFSAVRGGPDVQGAGQAVPKDNRDSIFLQLGRNCAERLEIARSLVAYVNRAVSGSPQMIVSPDVVAPGPDTIDQWGPAWADQPNVLMQQ